MSMTEQTNEIRWCATLEPIAVGDLATEGIQQAEGVVDVSHAFAEMVTIIHQLQYFDYLFISDGFCLCQFVDRIVKHRQQFFLGDAAQRVILRHHADVVRLVEPTEHTHL